MANLDELKEILDRLPEDKAKEIMDLAGRRASSEVEKLEKERIFPITGEFSSSVNECKATATISEDDKYHVSVSLDPGNGKEFQDFKFTREEFTTLADVFFEVAKSMKNAICSTKKNEKYSCSGEAFISPERANELVRGVLEAIESFPSSFRRRLPF